MILRTEKLQDLKKIQSQPQNRFIQELTTSIIKDVWPESNMSKFCQKIESMGIKWMNQFLIIIEHWLTETSSRFITKLKQLIKCCSNQESTQKVQQYLFNFSKYIQSMQYPLLSSINNIQNLYLKIPSDQTMQSPKNVISKQVSHGQFSQIKKKKSLSIESFTSNIPTKSRSTSKSRKLSFFNNSVKNHTNLFQTLSKQFKQKQNLNTTVKKVKKQMPFSKTTHISASTFKEGFGMESNQNQKFQKRTSDVNTLKQKLEERLTNTCSSTFFNQISIQPQQQYQSTFPMHYSESKNFPSCIQQTVYCTQNQNKLLYDSKIQKGSSILQQDFKKQILEQIQMKEKQSYQNLVKDIESKLNDKFQLMIDKIIKHKNDNQSLQKKQQLLNSNSQNTPKTQINNSKNNSNNIMKKDFNKNENIKQVSLEYPKEQISSKIKQNSCSSDIQDFHVQEIKSKGKIQQKKLNNSSVLQKDPSKIIKSKVKNTSILERPKQNIQMVFDKKNMSIKNNKPQYQTKNHKNQIISSNSIDSIEIIDGSVQNITKAKIQNAQQKSQMMNQKPSNLENVSIQPNQKKEDNFYMKRIKELKNKMQNCIKNYKIACEKLILPVNQTFLLLFSCLYKQFCKVNSLQMESQQVNQILSKYPTDNELKSKMPSNEEKFVIDSLLKIEKMINLKCPPEKKIKIEEYTQNCISCIENVFFQRPDLKLETESQIIKKIKQIKKCLQSSKGLTVN